MNDQAVAKRILDYAKKKGRFYVSDIAIEYLIPYEQAFRVLNRLLEQQKIEYDPPKAEQDRQKQGAEE